MTGRPQLFARCSQQRLVIFERAGIGAFVHVGDAVGHGNVADRGQFVLHHFHTQIRRCVGRAIVVHAKCHIADLNHLAMLHGRVGQHHLGAQGGLVGPALHQAAPQIALGAFELFDGGGQGVNGQLLSEGFDKGMVAQPMIAVVMAVEYRNHRLVGDLADHANRHLADLQGSARIEHHHARRSHHKNHVGHHAAVFWGGKTIGRENHPDMRRQLPSRDIDHSRAFNEVLGLLCQ